ncbi:YhjD/YihY/BrkB family envelope integrity protein [Verrucomicrobium sp. BvORR106]|nr:YhjD/YihY/BrkB family envelope integrity protein [Verrucomicrobium sp. BvORR106]
MDTIPSTMAPAGIKGWAGLLKATVNDWSKDNALRLSAALAYYSVFSIAPLLIIALAIAGLVLDDEAATGELYRTIEGYVGKQAAAGVQTMVESASKPSSGVVAALVGAATLLMGASGVLGQ